MTPNGSSRTDGGTESGHRGMPATHAGPKGWPSHIEVRRCWLAPPGPDRTSCLQRGALSNRHFAAAVALACAIAIAVVGNGCGSSTDNGSGGSATSVENGLRGNPSFTSELIAVSVSCLDDGQYLGHEQFSCTTYAPDGSESTAEWSFVSRDGTVDRISQGGASGSAPASAAQATARVKAVFSARTGHRVRVVCKPDGAISAGAYTCTVVDLRLHGTTTDDWTWNPDGTVSREICEGCLEK